MFDLLTNCIKWAVSVINKCVTKRITNFIVPLNKISFVLPKVCCLWKFLKNINHQSWPLTSYLTLDIVWRMIKIGNSNLQGHFVNEWLSVNNSSLIIQIFFNQSVCWLIQGKGCFLNVCRMKIVNIFFISLSKLQRILSCIEVFSCSTILLQCMFLFVAWLVKIRQFLLYFFYVFFNLH